MKGDNNGVHCRYPCGDVCDVSSYAEYSGNSQTG